VKYNVDVAAVARLIGNPARATMLDVLLDGRAHSASELAREARVAPSTASSHLADLLDGGLVTAERVGRQQLYRIADPRVARAMEALAILAPTRQVRSLRQAISDGHLRSGRTCYDHLAGRLGVALTDALIAERVLRPRDGAFAITHSGEDRLGALGVDVAGARKRRRGYALACLDWSERRPHLAGALGAALCDRLLSLGWISRRPACRGVVVTNEGTRGLREDLGVDLHEDTGPGRVELTSSDWSSRR
jgi:DNA-binding transcriptional ArsR family regulator